MADATVGVHVPVCMPTGGCKQSKSLAHGSVCSQNPICCPMAGLPPDHVFKLGTVVEGHRKLWSVRQQGPAADVRLQPLPPCFLLGLCCCHCCIEQTTLCCSGVKRATPCPAWKTAATEQAGTGSIGQTHSTIIWGAHTTRSEVVHAQRKAHGLIRNPWRHEQDIFWCLKTQLKNRFQPYY